MLALVIPFGGGRRAEGDSGLRRRRGCKPAWRGHYGWRTRPPAHDAAMASVNARRARINIGCGKANDRVEAKISQPKDVRCSSQQNDVGGASTKSLALPPRLRVLGYTKYWLSSLFHRLSYAQTWRAMTSLHDQCLPSRMPDPASRGFLAPLAALAARVRADAAASAWAATVIVDAVAPAEANRRMHARRHPCYALQRDSGSAYCSSGFVFAFNINICNTRTHLHTPAILEQAACTIGALSRVSASST